MQPLLLRMSLKLTHWLQLSSVRSRTAVGISRSSPTSGDTERCTRAMPDLTPAVRITNPIRGFSPDDMLSSYPKIDTRSATVQYVTSRSLTTTESTSGFNYSSSFTHRQLGR